MLQFARDLCATGCTHANDGQRSAERSRTAGRRTSQLPHLNAIIDVALVSHNVLDGVVRHELARARLAWGKNQQTPAPVSAASTLATPRAPKVPIVRRSATVDCLACDLPRSNGRGCARRRGSDAMRWRTTAGIPTRHACRARRTTALPRLRAQPIPVSLPLSKSRCVRLA